MKKCPKCRKRKSLDSFYTDATRKDGHRSLCKKCILKNDKLYQIKNKKSILHYASSYRRSEKGKAVIKLANKNYRKSINGKASALKKMINHKLKHYEKVKAAWLWRSYIKKTNLIIPTGYQSHHWDYNYPADIILLSREKHTNIHKRLIYDQESMCFKTLNGELLDTKRKHLEYIYN